MEFKALKRFTAIIDGKATTINKGDFAEILDDELLKECFERGILEDVPIMDTEEDEADEADTNEFLTLQQLQKLKNKNSVISYGNSIGLYEIDDSLTRSEIEHKIFEYINTLDGEDNA